MTQDERLMILQMVADKKISAAEAAELLRMLDGKEAEAAAATGAGGTGGPLGTGSGAAGAGTGPGRHGRSDAFRADRESSFSSGLSSFIEELVERFTSAFSEGHRYEFPTELTGTFIGEEIPLRIVTGNGRVEVRGWDQPGYKAEILVKARGDSEEEARRRAEDAYTVQADESGFVLETRRIEHRDIAVSVTLLVPRTLRYRLETRTGNGRITLEDAPLTEGRLVTGNGRVTVTDGRAESLTIRTGNGRIEVDGDVAELDCTTGNGAVRIAPPGTRSQQLRIATGNGSVRVETDRIPAETGLKVHAASGMGSISLRRSDMVSDESVRTFGNKKLVARTQGYDRAAARVDVQARTGLGSITIE